MILQLSLRDIGNVGGGESGMCRKTALSAAATICGGAGTMLQAFGQALHVNIADSTAVQQPVARPGEPDRVLIDDVNIIL